MKVKSTPCPLKLPAITYHKCQHLFILQINSSNTIKLTKIRHTIQDLSAVHHLTYSIQYMFSLCQWCPAAVHLGGAGQSPLKRINLYKLEQWRVLALRNQWEPFELPGLPLGRIKSYGVPVKNQFWNGDSSMKHPEFISNLAVLNLGSIEATAEGIRYSLGMCLYHLISIIGC